MKKVVFSFILSFTFIASANAQPSYAPISKDGFEVFIEAVGTNEVKASTQFAKDARKSVKCIGIEGSYVTRLIAADFVIKPNMLCNICPKGLYCAQVCIKKGYRAIGTAKLSCEPRY